MLARYYRAWLRKKVLFAAAACYEAGKITPTSIPVTRPAQSMNNAELARLTRARNNHVRFKNGVSLAIAAGKNAPAENVGLY